jgi:hypothetical protein
MPRTNGTFEERFWSKIVCDLTTRHWLWTGGLSHGYGIFTSGGRNLPAHRVAWELLVGPIPDGQEIDHVCRVIACVWPPHLEPVTHAVNIKRGKHLKTHWWGRRQGPRDMDRVRAQNRAAAARYRARHKSLR